MPSANSSPVSVRPAASITSFLNGAAAPARTCCAVALAAPLETPERAAELDHDAAHAAVADQHVGADAEDADRNAARQRGALRARRCRPRCDTSTHASAGPPMRNEVWRLSGSANRTRSRSARAARRASPLLLHRPCSSASPTRPCTSSSATPWMLPAPSTTTMSPTCNSGLHLGDQVLAPRHVGHLAGGRAA